MTFRECGNLNNIYIPASVKSIGNYAFYLCTNLATVNYGGTRTQWSDINVASNNSQLTNATINYNGEIASGTWGNLTWELEKSGMLIISGSGEMDFPWDGVTYPWRHYKDQVIQVWIRSNVTSIGHHAFVGYPNLQTVAISMPSSLTTIGQYAFSNCNSMTSISGIQNVTNIGKAAFSGSGLTYFTIPENMSSIDEEVFADCRNLSSVSIPASITSIGTNAFSECSSLTDIYYGDVPNKWRTIEVGSNNSSFLNATIHYGGAFDDYSSGPWGNLSWEAADGSNGLAYVMISGSGAMNDFSSDAAVAWRTDTLKNNVTDVDIESNITSIGNYAFMDFRNLRDIYHWKNIQSIGTGAFHGCVNLTEITLPDTVTIIKTGAFYGCTSLSEITIPAGVTMIQTMAFVKCENLRDVYYGGTQSQWNAINIGGANDPLLNATIHYQEPITYAITYNANGGTGAPSNQTKTHDIALTLSSTKPTRANSSAGSYTVTLNANDGIVSPTSLSAARTTSYTFKDWNTSANGSGTSYASGASYTANADVTLYAQWNSNTTTSAVTLPTPTRSGYTFKGWGTSSTANSGVTGSYTPSGNVTLYAIWSQVNHTVTYNANGGTGVPETQIKVVGTDLILSSVIPERTEQTESYLVTLNANGGRVSPQRVSAMKVTSYSFDGWNTAKDGSGTAYVPGEVYKTEADLNLYAQWNVTEENAEASLPTPNRDGYIFRGWAESADATEGVTGYYMPEKNVTLYAIWDIKTFTISYNANGGTDAPDAQSKTPGVALTLTTAIPKYEDCLFLGWAESADATTAAYQPGDSFTKDADITLYAVWLKPDFVLPDALTEIGEEAFANCAFTYVKLPENTDTIGKNAFANCPNLKYIFIPKNCLWIDRYAFTGVTGLTILGADGSYAQTYASGKGYDFIAVP